MKGTCFYFIFFFPARETHAGFKEELLQCMNGWILFTLEDVDSL